MNKIQVIVISQQVFLRQGIEQSLSRVRDITISATAEASDEVLSIIDNMPPDVALLDIDTPADTGLKLARRIKLHLPTIGVVVLTSSPDDAQLFQALKAQAVAYLSKEVDTTDLVNVIKRVAAGEHPINESLTTNPNVADQVLQQFQEFSTQSESEEFLSPLTQRETEILNLIAKGYLNRQIAVKFGTSEQIIKNHVTSIMRKLNTNIRTEAVVVAVKKGLISN